MPKLDIGIWLLVIVWLLYLGNWSFASTVSGNELVENAKQYNGKLIEYEGEVIGDIMKRGDHAWLNVNDGQRAIGIWASEKQINDIKYLGDYNHIGDKIMVTGFFQRACGQHGGDLDIHALKLIILEQGHEVKHPVSQWKITLAIILLVITLAVQLFFIWKARLAAKA